MSGSTPDEGASPTPRRLGGLRQVVLYGASRGLTESFFGARGLLLAALLGPAAFGAWTLFRLVARYAAFFDLSVRRGLEFEVSQTVEDDGRAGEAVAYGKTAFGFTAVLYSTMAVLAAVASFFTADPMITFGLRALAAAVVADRVWFYAMTYLRASGSLREFAALEIAGAAFHLVLSVALAWRWGLKGAFVGFAAAAALGTLTLIGRAPLSATFSRARLVRLLAVGWAPALAAVTVILLATVDRLVVAAMAGAEALGLYGFAASVATVAGSLAIVMRNVVFPEVYRSAAETGSGPAVKNLLHKAVAPFSLFYPPLLGVLALILAPVIAIVAPQYVDAIPPTRLFIFSGALVGFTSIGSVGLVAAARQRVLPVLAAVALVANLTLSASVLAAGLGLEMVAAAALVSRLFYGATILWLNARAAGIDRPLGFAARSMIPLLYCIAVVVSLGRLHPRTDLVSAALSLLLYLALLLPLAPMLWRRFRTLRW